MDDSRPLKVNRRWYRLTPDRFLLALLPIVGLLFLSERFRWFAFNEHKNWTVLIAVAVVCVAVVLLLLWLGVSLVFRRRFQFSIRSLLVLVVAVAVVCSWFAVKLQQARRQREAIEAIGTYIHHYYYELDADGNVSRGTQQLPGPAWVRNLLGVDFLSDVVGVGVDEGTDAKLVHLKELPPLVYLFLDGSTDGEAWTDDLEGLTSLQVLRLGGTQVSDAGLVYLEGPPPVRIERLSPGTQVTDAGLVHLEGLTSLESLRLDGTQVTDAGLVHLEGLTHLNWLSLGRTSVSDAGLVRLEGLTNLETLWLNNTQVTDAGVRDLQKALPNCRIRH